MSTPSKPDPLQVRGLDVRYGSVRALAGVDLDLREGEILALLGPSGCGKTTLLRAVAGFEPAAAGEIRIDGELVEGSGSHVPPHRRPVGLVFQDYALFPHKTVEGNIRYGLGAAWRIGRKDTDEKGRIDGLLALAGLEGLGKRYPHQLSGGQQQRVALLRSLAPRPRVLLLDEPFSNLDPMRRHEIRDEVGRLLRAEGVSAILVTHDRTDALAVAGRVAIMANGAILQEGPGDDVYRRPRNAEVARMLGDVQFVAAVVRDGVAATPLGTVRVTGPVEDGPAELLLRPEWIVPCETGAECGIVARRAEGAMTRLELGAPGGARLEMALPSGWTLTNETSIRVTVSIALPSFAVGGAR